MKTFCLTFAVLVGLNLFCALWSIADGTFFQPASTAEKVIGLGLSTVLGIWALCVWLKA